MTYTKTIFQKIAKRNFSIKQGGKSLAKKFTKEEVIFHKKSAIKKINNLMEMYINNPEEKYLKKANLLSYWLEDFSDYIREENNFNPKELISYKRGDVIKVNFGFNVGSEHGGLHYAIVLDNNNLHSSPVITVVPLSSGTAATTYQRDVFLGQELYIKMNTKNKSLLESARTKYDENKKILDALNNTIQEINQSETTVDQLTNILKIISVLERRQKEVDKDILLLEKYDKEISRMKQGSIALMEQISTISKMRIYVPKRSTDILYGVSFSSDAMEKINIQLINLFIRNNS